MSQERFPLRSVVGQRIVESIGRISDPAIRAVCMMFFNIMLRVDINRMPAPIFESVAGTFVLGYFELVVMRKVEGRREILLLKRSRQDVHWPGMWHIPGTAFRQTDYDFRSPEKAAFKRLVESEIPWLEITREPRFVGNVYPKYERGGGVCVVYSVEAQGENLPPHAAWVSEPDIDWVQELIHAQVELINMALEHDLRE